MESSPTNGEASSVERDSAELPSSDFGNEEQNEEFDSSELDQVFPISQHNHPQIHHFDITEYSSSEYSTDSSESADSTFSVDVHIPINIEPQINNFGTTEYSSDESDRSSTDSSDSSLDSTSSSNSQLQCGMIRQRKNKDKVKRHRIKRMRLLEDVNKELLDIVSSDNEKLDERGTVVERDITENDNLGLEDLPRDNDSGRNGTINDEGHDNFDNENGSSEAASVYQNVEGFEFSSDETENQISDDLESSVTNSSSHQSAEDNSEPEDSHSKPICTGSTVTRANFEATLLATSKKHKFSKSTRQDLLTFLEMIVPDPNIPPSNYIFEKDIWQSIGIKYAKYEFCPSCKNLLHLETRICQNRQCSHFGNNPSDEVTEMFFVIPIVTQLKRILSESWESVVQYKSNHNHNDGTYKDICCGQ